MNDNPLYDEELLAELLKLREENPDEFMELVMNAIKQNPDAVIEEQSNPAKKMQALAAIKKHYEAKEAYENCAFLRDLEKKINEKP